MPNLSRKPTRPASGRTAVARNSSATGLTPEMVRQALHRPSTPQEVAQQRARAAWEQRYQQITRSSQSYARSALVARQDGPIAYHAQARQRAELKYRAQLAHRLAVEKAATQQAVANQTYIRQGGTREERQLGRAKATEQQIARNTGEMMRANPETTGIASGVLVGSAVAAQVFAPEMALVRLAGTARWVGGARTALALERIGAGLTYQTGRMTFAGANQAGKVFLRRAVVDGALQYGGALIVNGGKQYSENGQIDVQQLFTQSTGGINATSMFMAGLPGDGLRHSLRNAALANAFEVNRDPETGWATKHVEPTWASGLNYAQKVGFSVGADALAGRFAGMMYKARLQNGYAGLARPGAQHMYDLWQQRMWLIHQADFIGVYGTKIMGGVAGSVVEPYLLPPTPSSTHAQSTR